MKIGIPKEVYASETRVALIPALIGPLKKKQHEVLVEAGAGVAASFSDDQFQAAGATIVAGAVELYRASQVILKVQPPQKHPEAGKHEVELMAKGAALIAFLDPLTQPATIALLAERGVTSFAMEYIPRITRAQSMDALSSMATVAGYKAVLIAAHHLGKFFPLLMTAAGTIPPATVLILGAGVAGLQAIATARRLGAKVEAFDPRPAVKEQVMSLGAHFVEMEVPKDVETAGGYAREQSEEFLRQEREAIAARLPKVDAVITTAQVFGKRAPLLLTDEMVKRMRPGSVIIDLAAGQGGNCTLTRPRETVVQNGVTIFGTVNLAATVPVHASQMYAKNITNLFLHLYQAADGTLNFQDEITQGACLTHQGAIVNEQVKQAVTSGGSKR
ncbi:Re/Si-specific NAD(P)(+) transhydrogenase subunit alpha [candidate division KSB1 bacterium]|nr:Re/Si-specific NAD(P)(+) transhydrogenase subunit alpha [bacterium]NUM64859.1 Re/Si-specific NAD(P)(+) transhydrogenase subunit alpha [candidate division KSB1 bacterium]